MSKKRSKINDPKLSIADRIGNIYEKSKDCGLAEDFFKNIDDELTIIAEYFKTTNIQAFLLANIITMNINGRSIGSREMSDHFGCSNTMNLLKYFPELDKLCEKRILKRIKLKRNRVSSFNTDYEVREEIIEAISTGKELEIMTSFEDIYQVLEYINILLNKVDDEDLDSAEVTKEIENIIIANQSFILLKKICNWDISIQDACLLLFMVWRTLLGIEEINLGRAVDCIIDLASKKIKYIESFLSGENLLIKKDLIEIIDGTFLNDLSVKLSENALNILEECEIKINSNKNKKRSGVIYPEDIIAKELIYNGDELKQLSLLKDLLDESNLNTTQCRLIERGLPQGITILFHGSPGTGKTETVYQIAKATDRQVLKVDIANSKSFFFGESEKKIKKIFTNYRAFAKECTKTPILLFNEADAIFSKRKDIGSSSITQTENSIQNIILEEIENFDGILVATTNLPNFDPALERRLLFKVEFFKPDIAVKAKIWALKLPRLSTYECESLASQFDFSGGQIDNVVRKSEITEIINGQSVDFDQIICFCNEEILNNNHRNKIGFT